MSELRLNFGCGGNQIPGWKNFDLDCDITKLPLPFGDESADMVLAEHLSEHTTGPDCLRFFREVHRILKPGGIFRVCVPTLDRITDRAQAVDLIVNHGHLQVFCNTTLRQMLWAAGFSFLNMSTTGRSPLDGHFREIGIEKDDQETLRLEVTK